MGRKRYDINFPPFTWHDEKEAGEGGRAYLLCIIYTPFGSSRRFYDDDVIRIAIQRYEKIWIPFIKEHSKGRHALKKFFSGRTTKGGVGV